MAASSPDRLVPERGAVVNDGVQEQLVGTDEVGQHVQHVRQDRIHQDALDGIASQDAPEPPALAGEGLHLAPPGQNLGGKQATDDQAFLQHQVGAVHGATPMRVKDGRSLVVLEHRPQLGLDQGGQPATEGQLGRRDVGGMVLTDRCCVEEVASHLPIPPAEMHAHACFLLVLEERPHRSLGHQGDAASRQDDHEAPACHVADGVRISVEPGMNLRHAAPGDGQAEPDGGTLPYPVRERGEEPVEDGSCRRVDVDQVAG